MDNNENNLANIGKWVFRFTDVVTTASAFYNSIFGSIKESVFSLVVVIIVFIIGLKIERERKWLVIAFLIVVIFILLSISIQLNNTEKNESSNSVTMSMSTTTSTTYTTTTTTTNTSSETYDEKDEDSNSDSSSSKDDSDLPVDKTGIEDGSSYLNAEKINLNSSVEINVNYSDDYYNNDNSYWLEISSANNGALNLSLTPSESLQPTLKLYGDDAETEISSASSENSIINLTTPIQKGTYYICVSYCASGSFTLSNSFTTSKYSSDLEKNNPFQNAKETLIIPSTINGNIGYYSSKNECDNSDFYKLVIDSSQIINLEFEGDPDLNITIKLLQSDGDSEICYDSGCNKKLFISQPLHKGTYYIAIFLDDSYGGYKITTSTKKINRLDEEPNDPYQNAKYIKANTKVYGNLGFKYEDGTCDTEDWYRIKLTNKKSITIKTKPDTSLYLYVTLIDKDGSSEICYTYGENETLILDSDILKPNRNYYIKISSSRDSYGTYEIIYK